MPKYLFFYLLGLSIAYQAQAAPKLVGAWYLEQNPQVRLYIHKDYNAYLSNDSELLVGNWSMEGDSKIAFQWANFRQEWTIVESKNGEWTAMHAQETMIWKKTEEKSRNFKLSVRRLLGTWSSTETPEQDHLKFVFRERNCLERTAQGLQRQLDWQLSEDANFLLLRDETFKIALRIVELRDYSLILQIEDSKIQFQRELTLAQLKPLETLIMEQKLYGTWFMENPTGDIRYFEMKFEADGDVQSRSDDEDPIFEQWKLIKRGRRLVIFSPEEETEYVLDIKIKKNILELREPEATLRLRKANW